MLAPSTKSYAVTQSQHVPYQVLMDYWAALFKADTLKYRFSDMENPKPHQVMEFVDDPTYLQFSVYDIESGKIVSEFAFESFTGAAAQVHFSMHPDNETKYSIKLATEVTDEVLSKWKKQDNPEEPFLETIFGLTPVDNRAASLFIRKAGFKKIGILPKGVKYMGNVTDAVLTVKMRKN